MPSFNTYLTGKERNIHTNIFFFGGASHFEFLDAEVVWKCKNVRREMRIRLVSPALICIVWSGLNLSRISSCPPLFFSVSLFYPWCCADIHTCWKPCVRVLFFMVLKQIEVDCSSAESSSDLVKADLMSETLSLCYCGRRCRPAAAVTGVKRMAVFIYGHVLVWVCGLRFLLD